MSNASSPPAPLSPPKAMLLMLVTAVLWSIAGLFIKLVPWNPLVIACGRSAIAGAVVLLYMKICHLRLRVTRRVMFCAFMLFGTMLSFVSANKLTTSANAIVLQNTSPVFIMLIGFLIFKHKITGPKVGVIVFTLAGIALFFVDSLTAGGTAGNWLGLLSGLFFGTFFVFSKELADTHESFSAIFMGQVLTAVLCLPFCFVYPPTLTPQSVGVLVLLGIVQLGLPYAFYAIASRSCSALTCSLIALAEPLFNPIWVFLAIGEAPGPLALLGGAIVLVTVTAWCVYSAKAKH